ncbi:hypothetical protein EVA_08627 [gut metagenome]|uniref:Uncharacterized protein n=1 Tax=gut metagenome TaxID=749906 RepID=J9G7P3_9ZZZZ
MKSQSKKMFKTRLSIVRHMATVARPVPRMSGKRPVLNTIKAERTKVTFKYPAANG